MRATGFATRNPVSEALYYVSAGLIGGYGVPPYAAVFCYLFYYTFLFSMGLFAFNLIPIPPLDGYHVIEHLLPYKVMYSEGFRNFTRYGPMVLMFLILIGNFGSFDAQGKELVKKLEALGVPVEGNFPGWETAILPHVWELNTANDTAAQNFKKTVWFMDRFMR